MKLKSLVQAVWKDRKNIALSTAFSTALGAGVLYPSQLQDTPPPIYTKLTGYQISSFDLLSRNEVHFENSRDRFPYKIKAVYRNGAYEEIAVQPRRYSKWCYMASNDSSSIKCDLPTLKRTQNFLRLISSTLQNAKP